MSVTDPIADMATLIRNASKACKEKVDIRASKVNEDILKILKNEKFILNYKRIDDYEETSSQRRNSKNGKKCPQGRLRVYLKFNEDKSLHITNIKRISKPGLRIYKNKNEILPVLGGLGINIVSTSQGILADKEAREKGLGGEVMLQVW